MKIKPGVKKIYDKCKMTHHHGDVMIIYSSPRHRQRQG